MKPKNVNQAPASANEAAFSSWRSMMKTDLTLGLSQQPATKERVNDRVGGLRGQRGLRSGPR